MSIVEQHGWSNGTDPDPNLTCLCAVSALFVWEIQLLSTLICLCVWVCALLSGQWLEAFTKPYILYVLFRENFHYSSTPTASWIIFFKINQTSSEINTTYSAAQFRQNKTLLFFLGAKIKDMELERGNKFSFICCPLHKVSMISMLILDEQQKKFLLRTPDFSHYSEGEMEFLLPSITVSVTSQITSSYWRKQEHSAIA